MGSKDIAKRTDRIIVAVLCSLACALVCWFVVGNLQPANDQAAGDSTARQEGADDAAQSVSSFDGKRAGVITGSFQDGVVERHLPHSSVYNYDTYTDLVEALNKNKIDYFLTASESSASLLQEHPNLVTLLP